MSTHALTARKSMPSATDVLTLGVEEEFQIVDRESGELASRSHEVRANAEHVLAKVDGELNLCQIEVSTPICAELSEVRSSLRRYRQVLQSAAESVGANIVAVASHPLGSWEEQQVDEDVERYRQMEDDYQIVARQQVVCGCHVHVGIADPDLRIAAMSRVRPWLPCLLALSANSPYWEGRDTGYASYRLQVWQHWPTLGMPPEITSAEEYERLVAQLRAVEAIDDPSYLYWYVRPSNRYPTLEFRPFDVCLTVDAAVAVAGLVRGLAWMCVQEALAGEPQAERPTEVYDAAMWRAARYGLDSTLVSVATMSTRPAASVIAEMLAYCRPGLEAHGDWEEVDELVGRIVADGTGATIQRRAFQRRRLLRDVVAEAVAQTTG